MKWSIESEQDERIYNVIKDVKDDDSVRGLYGGSK